jgi:excinuclease ABC subunit C
MGVEVIREALAGIPQSSGVYLMKDRRGRVIYVGKAKRLRSRVANYARREAAPTWYRHKVEAMVERVEAVDYVVTASEKEALLLENTLIKEHRPCYNVDLRDDKTYPYFRLSLQHEFPRLSLVRKPAANDGARYFGPFENAGAARRVLRMLQRVFPLRRCSDHALGRRRRPCLDHETGRCLAPCAGKVDPGEYRELARQLERFFAGEGEQVARDLERRMHQAAQAERFEEAAALRDRWQALARTLERQNVAKAEGRDADALALHHSRGVYRLAVLSARHGRVVASRVFELEAALAEDEAMGQALNTFYDAGRPPPPLVLVSHLPADPGLVVEVLGERAGRKVELRRPRRGEMRGLLGLAEMNAAQPRTPAAEGPEAALERVAAALGLSAPPARLECVDISHLGGRLTVASLVAMDRGRWDKARYRRYKVLGQEGRPDDFAAMAEVVGRRLSGDREPPDLLLLDGGKGQLNAALEAMAGLPAEARPAVAAIAKGRGAGPDKVYLPGRKNPLSLRARDSALLLLMRLRDEAHRFAISYHRLLRKKALTRSILEEAPGVGPKRRQRLLAAFGSLAALKKANAAEIVEKAGLDQGTAAALEAFLAALDTT